VQTLGEPPAGNPYDTRGRNDPSRGTRYL